MTREELKEHCEKQIEMCEFWAIGKGEKPSGKVYEEHKLILELLEQEPRKGHWILRNSFLVPYKCSECNYKSERYDNYCPNCGCRMVEPQESEDKE